MILLGGTPDQQREFLQTLNPEQLRPRFGNDRRRQTKVPISNKYGLGYTYQDVLDADQEDVLARLHVHMLSNPSAHFVPLLQPLFTKKTVPDTLMVILLDWADPFKWPRQLRQWIRLIRGAIYGADAETKAQMDETMNLWRNRRVGPDSHSTSNHAGNTADQATPAISLGPGEWDEDMGVPLSVVCIHTEKVARLEQDLGWQEDQFDYLMQWLRTVLLKHGASLIYTTTFEPANLRTLIQSSLSIESLLRRETVKHDVVSRDKILVPPNWDSWGKIRVLNKDFDPEAVSKAWSVELYAQPDEFVPLVQDEQEAIPEEESAVSMFEAVLPDPASQKSAFKSSTRPELVTCPDTQTFLAQHMETLQKYKEDDEQASRRSRKGAPAPIGSSQADSEAGRGATGITDHIGPYQINVNGIDFDAEEATRRIKERKAERMRKTDPQKTSGVSTPRRDKGSESGEPPRPRDEALSTFFADLMKKGRGRAGGSGATSPTRGSPAPERSRG